MFVASQISLGAFLSRVRNDDLPTEMRLEVFLMAVTLVQLGLSIVLKALSLLIPQSRHHPFSKGVIARSTHDANHEQHSPIAGHRSPNFAAQSRIATGLTIISLLCFRSAYYQTVPTAYTLTDTQTLYLFTSVSIIVIPALNRLLANKRTGHPASLLLILAGLSILQPGERASHSRASFLFLLLQLLLSSVHLILSQEFYQSTEQNLHAQNIHLSAVQLFALYVTSSLNASGPGLRDLTILSNSISLTTVFLHGCVGLALSGVLKYADATVASVLAAVSCAVLRTTSIAERPTLTITVISGTSLIFYGFYVFNTTRARPWEILESGGSPHEETVNDYSQRPAKRFWTSWKLLSIIGVIIIASIIQILPNTTPQRTPYPRSRLLAPPLTASLAFDILLLPPAELTTRRCKRRLLDSHIYHAMSSSDRTSRHIIGQDFRDILLIVFFSHARYDVNLDSYREAYAPYFPNMLFVGPASREDRGFRHSYDVILDSYQADEDLSDMSWFKMAGRMAHHMLFTVLSQYVSEEDCYQGYLWAPFDALLNVPRLSMFPRDQVWYHSPFGEKVPNPALKNVSLHAPPANISPDPYGNVSEIWRGWGPDWWWGDPHVGLGVCMPAFELVSSKMRQRLALKTDGETRLIGGSSDTLYLPHRLRSDFLHVLGLFLETDCFLEIALPTAVHLVLPPNEKIAFVDHWWIWRPPFNTSFVWQQWALGYEVDSFHTFHWGEMNGTTFTKHDGVVEDVRALFDASVARQKGVRTS